MTESLQASWDKIAAGGEHVARLEGDKFATALNQAIGEHVQGIAGQHGVALDGAGHGRGRA